jgi:putative flippase GtrA/glycosyltransferase involved in cell wall biosynthesis
VIGLFAKFKRKLIFGSVGLSSMLVGYATLFACVHWLRLSPTVAYAIQALVAIELNFVLSYTITWRDREKSFWISLVKFHVPRLATIPLNQVLFNAFVYIGVNYLIANALCIIFTMVFNYTVADRFVFGKSKAKTEDPSDDVVVPGKALNGSPSDSVKTPLPELPVFAPRISVVIPTKDNKGSIAHTVRALQNQHYPHPIEIIVVGDTNDSAWGHLEEFGQRVRRIGVNVDSPGRDSNMKRNIGMQHMSIVSTILSTIDDDVIPEPTWALEVSSLLGGVVHAVAGPVVGLGDSFWSRYIDKNPVATKTPRIASEFLLNPHTLKREKFPVTANFAITRKLYEAVGGPNPAFTNSYEDYSWMSWMIQNGYGIYCTPRLNCKRYHREGLRPLIREYLRSGKGCADLVVTYKDCTFARRRVKQLRAFYGLAGIGVALAVLNPFVVGVIVAGIATGLAVSSIRATRRVQGAVYPFISLLLGMMFIIGFSRRLLARQKLVMPEVREIRFIAHAEAAVVQTLQLKIVRPASAETA